VKGKLKNLLTGDVVEVTASLDSPDSSYGLYVWVDDAGNSYGQIRFFAPLGYELIGVDYGAGDDPAMLEQLGSWNDNEDGNKPRLVAALEYKYRGLVVSDGLRVRNDPSVNAKVIGYLSSEQEVSIEDIITDDLGVKWAKLGRDRYCVAAYNGRTYVKVEEV